MTNELDKLRADINALDAELVSMLARRSVLSAEIGAAKPVGSAIFRPGREARLKADMTKLAERHEGVGARLIEQVWQPLLRASIAQQKPNFSIAYPPEAKHAAARFSSGILGLTPAKNSEHSLDMLHDAKADIAFIAETDLATLAPRLGADSGLYVIAKHSDWYLVGTGLPDASYNDAVLVAQRTPAGVDVHHRAGYNDRLDPAASDSWIVGMYQLEAETSL